MNCPSCGGPMDVDQDRMVFRCKYCNSIHIPEKDDDGIAILKTSDVDLDCPVCNTRLSQAIFQNFPVFCCSKCRGLLIEHGIFEKMVIYLRSEAKRKLIRQTPIREKDMDRQIICPGCDNRMEPHPYLGPGSVVIDSCTNCHLVWLDYNELNRIIGAP